MWNANNMPRPEQDSTDNSSTDGTSSQSFQTMTTTLTFAAADDTTGADALDVLAGGDQHAEDEEGQQQTNAVPVVEQQTADESNDENVEAYLACKVQDDGSLVCLPHKRETLKNVLLTTKPGLERRNAVISSLQDMGVKVFVIQGNSVQTTKEILDHIRRIVGFVARENRIHARTGPLGYQRCLLYQDKNGRLFNLLLSKHAVGPANRWEELLDSFSGKEAMVALTVLCRSFPCATRDDLLNTFKPAYLSLVLGLVLTEEISMSWLNASMLVRGTPSVSAHSLVSPVGSDLLRKGLLLCLALAGTATGTVQRALTMAGISGACMVLLANLGSRAWHFLGWKPQRYHGLSASLVAYMAAIATGIFVPYMGHRDIEVGGKAAMEYVIKTAFIVAAVFVISDFDAVQQFIIVGSEQCPQDGVNIVVGLWWTITLFCSLFMVRMIPYKRQMPNYDGELLLEKDHSSPVGYKVPKLSDFEIDPSLAKTGNNMLSLKTEFAIGILMSVFVGTAIIVLAFTSWDDDLIDNVSTYVGDVL